MKKPVLSLATLSLLFCSLTLTLPAASGPKLSGLFGFESYGLREFSFEKVVDTTRELGLDHVEIFAGHLGPASDQAKVDEALRKLAAKKVKISGVFVGNVGPDSKVTRTFFEFARKMSTRVVIVNQIDERGIEGLNKLCDEYPEVRVCFHNHGPKSQGETLVQVQALLAKLHKHVGACIDTGHVQRSKEDPVVWAQQLKGRIFGAHLKEYHGHRPLGAGTDLATKDFLLALAEGNFPAYGSLAVEFEGTPKDPFEGIKVSVEYARKLIEEINAGK